MEDALKIVKKQAIDIVFMDINIDGPIDGISCAKILNEHYFLPIIFTTAYGNSSSIQEASETNIFGYIIKPFEANEVEATLTIALKRVNDFKSKLAQPTKIISDTINLGDGQIYNLPNKTFTVNRTVIDFTEKERNVFFVLSQNLNQNVSYDILKYIVWENNDISNSTIRDIVSRIKRKAPILNIENIINFGYILKGKN
jgi:DNA-binding response OmpR family regulator